MVPGWKPRLTVRALRPVIAGLEALGHDAEALLAEAGIPHSILADPERHLPPGSMVKLWDRSVSTTGDDRLGMHVAMAAPLNAFEMHAYAMLSSPTLRDAYHRACRYHGLINEAAELTFTEGPKEAVLRHGLPGGRSVSRHPAEFLVTTWLRFGRLVTGSQWAPAQVFFAHDRPTDAREHAALFGTAVQFTSGQTAMHVPAAVLELPNPHADPTLVALLDRYASALLERQPPLTTVSACVRAWLVEAHSGGVPSARLAAKALAMSERTLHRRLEHERTTFRKLLDQFRHEKAVALLASRRYSIADVAFLLGYSELSAFYRAFRRWTGRSPAELRDDTPQVGPAADP
jgi:AraC-like DNA-binding protein